MTRAELEHAIRAACEVARDKEVWVFGSQAILASYPDAPEVLRRSVEVDVSPKNHPERVDLIDGALGELSQFHATYGFYVHGVPIESARLPSGWTERAIPVSGKGMENARGLCLEAHDLAASKLAAAREKDRAFVRTLLVERLVDPAALTKRIQGLPVDQGRRALLAQWVTVNSVDR